MTQTARAPLLDTSLSSAAANLPRRTFFYFSSSFLSFSSLLQRRQSPPSIHVSTNTANQHDRSEFGIREKICVSLPGGLGPGGDVDRVDEHDGEELEEEGRGGVPHHGTDELVRAAGHRLQLQRPWQYPHRRQLIHLPSRSAWLAAVRLASGGWQRCSSQVGAGSGRGSWRSEPGRRSARFMAASA
jgi:hypothetical protein